MPNHASHLREENFFNGIGQGATGEVGETYLIPPEWDHQEDQATNFPDPSDDLRELESESEPELEASVVTTFFLESRGFQGATALMQKWVTLRRRHPRCQA